MEFPCIAYSGKQVYLSERVLEIDVSHPGLCAALSASAARGATRAFIAIIAFKQPELDYYDITVEQLLPNVIIGALRTIELLEMDEGTKSRVKATISLEGIAKVTGIGVLQQKFGTRTCSYWSVQADDNTAVQYSEAFDGGPGVGIVSLPWASVDDYLEDIDRPHPDGFRQQFEEWASRAQASAGLMVDVFCQRTCLPIDYQNELAGVLDWRERLARIDAFLSAPENWPGYVPRKVNFSPSPSLKCYFREVFLPGLHRSLLTGGSGEIRFDSSKYEVEFTELGIHTTGVLLGHYYTTKSEFHWAWSTPSYAPGGENEGCGRPSVEVKRFGEERGVIEFASAGMQRISEAQIRGVMIAAAAVVDYGAVLDLHMNSGADDEMIVFIAVDSSPFQYAATGTSHMEEALKTLQRSVFLEEFFDSARESVRHYFKWLGLRRTKSKSGQRLRGTNDFGEYIDVGLSETGELESVSAGSASSDLAMN